MKAAFINGDIYTGDNTLKALTQIKTKNELIGEVIGLLQSPVKRVLAALLHNHEKQANGTAIAEVEAAPEVVAAPVVEAAAPESTPPAAAEVTPAAE